MATRKGSTRKSTATATAKTTRARSRTTTKSKATTRAAGADKPAAAAKATTRSATTTKPAAAKAPARKTVKVSAKPAAKPIEATGPAAKAATGKTPAAPAAAPVTPVVVNELTPVVEGPVMRKRAFIDTLTERSGLKRRDAKAAAEAALEILGEAIAAGKVLNLPGLGKLKVVRSKKLAHAQVYVARVRQPDARPPKTAGPEGSGEAPKPPKDPLAEAAE